ncbi:MAG: winged helix-turn-helix domain-containing protein [Rhodoluna sp.]|jgi:DNA-binding response OmpR family regulator|nr:winged helix-turn-helix domain-containing protein [Rhodoluna sp.]
MTQDIQSEARGFALYVGVDEQQAVAAGVSLTELVRALRSTLNELVPGSETYAAVALAPKGAGGRNVDVVRTALHDPRALDQLVARTDTDDETEDGVVVDLSRRRVLVNGENAELTSKEFDLLTYLIENQGETISRRELVELVWNTDEAVAPNDRTIDVHIRRLRSKIAGFEDIIRTIRGGGYRFDSHPDVHVEDYQI